MNHRNRIGTVIAGIAAVLTMGAGIPAFAGQYDNDSHSMHQRQLESRRKISSARRRAEFVRAHSRQYGNPYGTWSVGAGNHYGHPTTHDERYHSNRSNGNHGNRDNRDNRDNRNYPQTDWQRNHQDDSREHGNH